MSDEEKTFRLDDDEPPPKPKPTPAPPPPAPPEPEGNGRSVAEVEAQLADRARRTADLAEGDEPQVDTRTVAERRGEAVETVAGRRPPPEGWPGEAFAFPLRSGPWLLAGSVAFWVVLDALTWVNLFLGAVVKFMAYAYFIRWQLHVASMSAGGHDRPGTFAPATEMEMAQVRSIGRLILFAILLLAPGVVAAILGNTALAIVLFVLGSVYLSVVALGTAVGDASLVYPWHAGAWIGARPLGLLGASMGWWAAGVVEWAVSAIALSEFGQSNLPLALLLFALLRVAFVYLWVVSARVLGVVGREWSPYVDETP